MENFTEKIRTLSKRVEGMKDSIATEEATKTSIIMPFFSALGYDVFNPMEFVPEYVADVGIKKGEKVDYAILNEGKPVILIEAKSINENLQKHDSQLFRYFGTTSAKFGILTNGLVYRFYTDLEEKNKMDTVPFFEFNLLDSRETSLKELAKFRKESFDLDNIFSTASDLKYLNKIKVVLNDMFENPSEDFVRFITSQVYDGVKNKNVMDNFTILVGKASKQYINELVSDKINAALKSTDDIEVNADEQTVAEKATKQQVVTTVEELQGLAIIKLMINDIIPEERIFYRDNLSYFNVLVDDNNRKWVCRLHFNENSKGISFNDDEQSSVKIEKISDVAKYKKKLIEVASKFK